MEKIKHPLHGDSNMCTSTILWKIFYTEKHPPFARVNFEMNRELHQKSMEMRNFNPKRTKSTNKWVLFAMYFRVPEFIDRWLGSHPKVMMELMHSAQGFLSWFVKI